MSKRYGRNQKRQHREKIAELETAYKRELSLLGRDRDKYKHMWDELTSDIRRWWDHSVLLDPKVENVSEFPREWRIAHLSPINTQRMMAPMDLIHSTDCVHQTYQTLSALEVAAMRDYGTRDAHIRLRINDHNIGYYVSDSACRTFKGMPQRMAREVSEMIIRKFNSLFERPNRG